MIITKLPEDGVHFIDYEVTRKSITFGDEELSINLSKKERDYEISVDVIRDYSGGLLCAINSSAERYVAQVIIPAREYVESIEPNPDYDPDDPESEEEIHTRTAVPFDIDRCELKLYEEE